MRMKNGPPLNDPAIRRALAPALLERHPQALLLNEMHLRGAQAIVDLAAIDASFHAYEIKSDLDGLQRLVRQAAYYDRTCDFVTLITTRRQHEGVIPPHWGMALASVDCDGVTLEWVRDPSRNVNARVTDLLYVLRGTELVRMLRANGQRGAHLLSKASLVDRVVNLLGEPLARKVALEVLHTRKTWSIRQLGVGDEAARLRHAISQPPPRLAVLSGSLF